MSKRKNDIERYLRGEMTSAEMHELEKQALSDPFLSEALEGVQQAGADSFLFDLKELRHSFHHRARHKPKIISMWRWSLGIAAGLVLLAVSSVYIIININQKKNSGSLAIKQNNHSIELDKQARTDSATVSQQPSKSTSLGQGNSSKEIAEVEPSKEEVSDIQSQPSANSLVDNETEKNEKKSVIQTETIEPSSKRIADADIKEAPKDTVIVKSAREKTSMVPVSRVIRGKVISEDNKVVIPGANVLVKGTNRGAVTDIDGSYEIAVDNPKQVLAFTSIGYKTVEVVSENKTELNIQLKTDDLALSEVVIAGYTSSDENRKPVIELAAPKGGRDAFQVYLKKNVRYPQAALQNKIEGRVTIQFTVNASGQLSDFNVQKGIGYGCEEELLRVIKEGPAWSPSKQNNQPVNDKVKVRFKFELPD
jgi:TonB family protein